MGINLDIESDMIQQCPDVWKSLEMLNNPDINIRELQLSLPSNPLATVTRRLIPKYIEDYALNVLYYKYKNHIIAFKEGFEISIPEHVKKFFRLEEFESILFGQPEELSREQFLQFSDFKDEAVKSFMEKFLEEITADQRRNLLRFITGSESLIALGIRKINVVINPDLAGKYPTASTCGPTLKLPPIKDFESLKSKLEIAIMDENIRGFHFEPGVHRTDHIVLHNYTSNPEYLQFSDTESDLELESD